jgi:hypothetical protein
MTDSMSMPEPPHLTDTIDSDRSRTLSELRSLRAALGERAELRAMAVVHQKAWQRGVESCIDEAMARIPREAGPLNSQRLVATALRSLEERSPEYLRKLVSYLDTLQWLEEQA